MSIRVLIQAGHVAPREPGFESGTGTVREQELTKALQRRLVALFRADKRFEPVACPGDIPDGISVDAALFLHGDGAASKEASGYSFGFPQHQVNAKLAKLINEEFEKISGHPPHHADNYTGGLREYYGYRRVETPGPEVLVEHGFLTNPGEQKWIFKNLDQLATAEYRAVCGYFDLAPKGHVKNLPALGFRVVGEKDGEARVVKRTLEPGRAVDKMRDWGATVITVRKNRVPIQPTGPIEKDDKKPAKDHKVTSDTRLLSAPRATRAQLERFLVSGSHGSYSDKEVRAVASAYDETARAAGLDPLLVVAQMVLETGHLTSEWSQPPRRNPAGIGVTGEPGKGISFPDWDSAVTAHVGRLLAYSLAKGAETDAQKRLIDDALHWRPLPDSLRGAAPTLSGLAGTWAADKQYATKIANIANKIRSEAP
jgi:hypothetical protein